MGWNDGFLEEIIRKLLLDLKLFGFENETTSLIHIKHYMLCRKETQLSTYRVLGGT